MGIEVVLRRGSCLCGWGQPFVVSRLAVLKIVTDLGFRMSNIGDIMVCGVSSFH
jgi:hypothetical protein